MTDDMMGLQGLLAKQPDADIVREMLGIAAQNLWSWRSRARPVPPTASAASIA